MEILDFYQMCFFMEVGKKKSVFQETTDPNTSDYMMMGNSVMFIYKYIGEQVQFEKSSWKYTYTR